MAEERIRGLAYIQIFFCLLMNVSQIHHRLKMNKLVDNGSFVALKEGHKNVLPPRMPTLLC